MSPPTSAPSLAPSESPIPARISANDPIGDQLDENEEPIDGVDYQDIVSTSAEWRDRRLHLVTEVAAAPPTVDPLQEVITFAWHLDTTMDGVPDWLLIVENLDEPDEENAPGWGAALTRMPDGRTFAGPEFPGSLMVDGTQVTVTTDLPDRADKLGIAAMAEHTVWTSPTNANTVRDDHPEDQFPTGDQWLVISTE